MELIRINYQLFINSFKKINLKIFLILLLDILFYFVFMQAGSFFMAQIEKKGSALNLAQNFLSLDQQLATNLLSSVRGYLFFIIFTVILFIILMIISWSFFKGMIWNLTTNKKFNLEFFKKFLLLNLIWLPAWLMLILLFALIIKPQTAPIFIIITLITAFYFTNILYPLFLKDKRLRSMKNAFKLGITKIHHFIIPYLIIIIIAFIVFNLHNFIALRINLNQNIILILVLILIAWLRYYFVEIVNNLTQ